MKTLKVKSQHKTTFFEFESDAELIKVSREAQSVDRSDHRFDKIDSLDSAVEYLTHDAQSWEINTTRTLDEVVEAVRARLPENYTQDYAWEIICNEFKHPESATVSFDQHNVADFF